jgi:hypothetical protein
MFDLPLGEKIATFMVRITQFFMDIYTQKSRWKLYLAISGIVIVAISMVYTNYLTSKLAAEEKIKAELWVKAMEDLHDFNDDEEALLYCDVTLHTEILKSNTTIPVIVVNERGSIYESINVRDTSREALLREVEEMKQSGFEPIQGYANFIYYKESNLLRQLRYFPFVQLLLIAAFVGFGYMGFNSSRRAEQNRVWVGMAKETAHQLGTPISAILAWVEHLKLIRDDDGEVMEVLGELRNDISRLELIAERFSKIGSAPKLETINVYQELEKCRAYMQRRASRKIAFEFPDPTLAIKTQKSILLYLTGLLKTYCVMPLMQWVEKARSVPKYTTIKIMSISISAIPAKVFRPVSSKPCSSLVLPPRKEGGALACL